MAAVLSAEIINVSDCRGGRSISLWMYPSLTEEGNHLVCVWPLLNDELVTIWVKNVSQAPRVPDLQSLDVFCNNSCGEVEAG